MISRTWGRCSIEQADLHEIHLIQSGELQTNRFTDRDIFLDIGQQTGLAIYPKNLNFIIVPTRHQQEFPVGSKREVTGMSASELVPHSRKSSFVGVNGKNSNPVSLQSVRGIEKAAVGRHVDIRATPCTYAIGSDHLFLL